MKNIRRKVEQAAPPSDVIAAFAPLIPVSLTEASKEAIWLSNLLEEIGQQEKGAPIHLNGDNHGAIALTANPEHHRRT